jgi:lipid-A-disaccharide synthase
VNLYLIAGERSGDLHAGNLIRSMKTLDPDLLCRGFGGEEMQSAGMSLAVHYRQLAFMGFVEVILNLRTISKMLSFVKEDITEFSPDAIVLVDYAGFNLRVASWAKKQGYKVFWYISPKVWAWNQSRALKLKRWVDRMFVILPFEVDFFKKYNWQVDYVGNPVWDSVKKYKLSSAGNNDVDNSGKPLVALLPGSRKQEVEKVMPSLVGLVQRLPDVQFVLAGVDNLADALYRPLQHLSNVKVVMNRTYNLLQEATAAVVTSGTATLETCLFNVPQVVVYRANALSFAIGKRVIRVPYISLVNLIAGKEVVKELIQEQCTPESIAAEVQRLLTDERYRDGMQKDYTEIQRTLDTGSASDNAARLMQQYLKAG